MIGLEVGCKLKGGTEPLKRALVHRLPAKHAPVGVGLSGHLINLLKIKVASLTDDFEIIVLFFWFLL